MGNVAGPDGRALSASKLDPQWPLFSSTRPTVLPSPSRTSTTTTRRQSPVNHSIPRRDHQRWPGRRPAARSASAKIHKSPWPSQSLTDLRTVFFIRRVGSATVDLHAPRTVQLNITKDTWWPNHMSGAFTSSLDTTTHVMQPTHSGSISPASVAAGSGPTDRGVLQQPEAPKPGGVRNRLSSAATSITECFRANAPYPSVSGDHVSAANTLMGWVRPSTNSSAQPSQAGRCCSKLGDLVDVGQRDADVVEAVQEAMLVCGSIGNECVMPAAGTSTTEALDVDGDLGRRVGLDRRPDRFDRRLGHARPERARSWCSCCGRCR